jgi:hypothetical protein
MEEQHYPDDPVYDEPRQRTSSSQQDQDHQDHQHDDYYRLHKALPFIITRLRMKRIDTARGA